MAATDDPRVPRVRGARQDEAHAIADLWLRSRAASVPAIPAPVHTEEEVRRYYANVVLPQRDVWVATIDEVIAGMLVLDDAWVDQLYVEPDRTSRGIGTMLLELAKARRPQGLSLWTFQSNTDARRFYEHHGFVAVAYTDGDNEEGAPDVCYEWRPGR